MIKPYLGCTITALLLLLTAPTPGLRAQVPRFVRGDINLDGGVSFADVVSYLQFRYLGGAAPDCMDAADVDDNGMIDTATSADAFFLFDWLLRRRGSPTTLPAPFPLPGVDPTADGLGCAQFATTPPGPAAQGYEHRWRIPASIVRRARKVDAFLLVTTAAAVDSFSAAYRINKAVLADVRVDLQGTVFPTALQSDFEASQSFGYAVVPSADPEFDLLLVGAVFIGFPPVGTFTRIPFRLTSGAVTGQPILRLTARVRSDAPLGPQDLLLPAEAEDFVEGRNLTHGVKNEFGGQDGDSEFSITTEIPTSVILEGQEFLRGNANDDLKVDLSDAVHTLAYLFGGGPEPICPDAADANDSGVLDVSDAVTTLNFLFQGTAVLPIPGPFNCGTDETDDDIECCKPTQKCPSEFAIDFCN